MAEFDRKIKAERCPTRSKAVGDLIRAGLVQTEWRAGEKVVGAIVLVYHHHKRDVMQRLTDVQYDCHDAIISTQHVHLDHDNCLEIVDVCAASRCRPYRCMFTRTSTGPGDALNRLWDRCAPELNPTEYVWVTSNVTHSPTSARRTCNT